MRHILLFQGSCAACSKVARMVDNLSVSGLETLSIESAEATQLLAMAGVETLERPSLLIVDDGQVEIKNGWAMRRRLARVIGARRGTALVQLSIAEWHAAASRKLMPSSAGRRGFLGGAAAAIAGLILLPGKAFASAEDVPAEGSVAVPSAESVQRALLSQPMKTAVRTWGPTDDKVHEVTRGAQRVLAFQHSRDNVVTFVDISQAASATKPTAVSMGRGADGASLRFYTVQGTPLADITKSGSSIKVAAPPKAPADEPDDLFSYICFVGCLGSSVSVACANACFSCDPGQLASLPNCLYCAVCAGPSAIGCARQCSG
jgi:predicted DCC family thiol-disulfide oxidoreductase YuxK